VLARHPRCTFHFTPTSASWLNAVEGFFAILAKRHLKRSVFRSVADLQAAINRFLDGHNAHSKPFQWAADPDKIIAAVRRGHKALYSVHLGGRLMPFLLRRGGMNVPLEVQRWQYFLLRNKIPQAGTIDAQFGLKTEEGTKIFQMQHALKSTGRLDKPTLKVAKGLGYTVQRDDYYDDKRTDAYPARPGNISSPSNADRNKALGCFMFKQLPLANRGDPDEIVPLGSCDGKTPDWRKANIIDIELPQLQFATGYSGRVTCHRLAAPGIVGLFAHWEKFDLLHIIRAFNGAYNPRYKRGQSPSPDGHGPKYSDQVDALSNHAFGSAFDINFYDNPYGQIPVLCPQRGCTRELVKPANDLGFFWGGHFSSASSKDGMHFELAQF